MSEWRRDSVTIPASSPSLFPCPMALDGGVRGLGLLRQALSSSLITAHSELSLTVNSLAVPGMEDTVANRRGVVPGLLRLPV